MKILVACEESQRVCIEFRKLGHDAYSCDIEPESGGHPEWHIQCDVNKVLTSQNNGYRTKDSINFITNDGTFNIIGKKWDMILAFPPCTYLTVSGNRWFKPEYKNRFPTREQDRKDAINFFMTFANANCDYIAIENPVGIMSTKWRKPDQIVHPYMFGDPERKQTCLWLKGLPKLVPTNIVEPRLYTYKDGRTDSMWHMETFNLPKKERSKVRSKTFPGLAKAMAEQWSYILNEKLDKDSFL